MIRTNPHNDCRDGAESSSAADAVKGVDQHKRLLELRADPDVIKISMDIFTMAKEVMNAVQPLAHTRHVGNTFDGAPSVYSARQYQMSHRFYDVAIRQDNLSRATQKWRRTMVSIPQGDKHWRLSSGTDPRPEELILTYGRKMDFSYPDAIETLETMNQTLDHWLGSRQYPQNPLLPLYDRMNAMLQGFGHRVSMPKDKD